MVFSTVEFLFLFLPITLGLYFFANQRAQNAILLVASLVFYTWGSGQLILVFLAYLAVNYGFGRLVGYGIEANKRWPQLLGIFSAVVAAIGLLGYYKYANFAVAQYTSLGASFGFEPPEWTKVVLPIGISFYTFQTVSYIVDIYRREGEVQRNPINFALYVALFPQLIAGPIVRYNLVAEQINNRTTTLDTFGQGALRFSYGLFKKVVIADTIAVVADTTYGLPGGDLTMATAWLGVFAYTLQLYFDFSGYSDMAIGLGMMLGFKFPENFNRPYSAISITDFWRRWHMTLSNWFRDYVYIPLGGNRGSAFRTYFNLSFVFLVTGIWHGANWTFILWGIFHGAILIIERISGTGRVNGSFFKTFHRRLLTFVLVMIGWTLFRAQDLGQAEDFYKAMVDFNFALDYRVRDNLTPEVLWTFVVAIAAILVSQFTLIRGHVFNYQSSSMMLLRLILVFVLLPWTIMRVMSATFSPFLYFQF